MYKGAQVLATEHRVALYAEDMVFVWQNPTQYFDALKRMLKKNYAGLSGYKINKIKSVMMGLCSSPKETKKSLSHTYV